MGKTLSSMLKAVEVIKPHIFLMDREGVSPLVEGKKIGDRAIGLEHLGNIEFRYNDKGRLWGGIWKSIADHLKNAQ